MIRLWLVLSIAIVPTIALAQTRPATYLNLAQLKKLAERGDTGALAELGRRTLLGRGMPADAVAGVALLEKAAAAGSGDAMFELYLCRRDGIGMTRDEAKAEQWLAKSSEFKHGRARAELIGRILKESQDPAVAAPLAKELIELARGGDASAQYSLGLAWTRGIGGKTDAGEAQQWLLKAAGAGDERVALPAAQVFRDGAGVLRADAQRAGVLLRRLADRGVMAAALDLAQTAPDTFRALAKDSSFERIGRDIDLVGFAVKFDGRFTEIAEKQWTLADEKGKRTLRLLPPTADPSTSAAPGRFVRVWGVVTEPGVVRTLQVEVPEPVYKLRYDIVEPRVVKGANKDDFVVEGQIQNTGKQAIRSLKLSVRAFQGTTGKEAVKTVTIVDLPPGAGRAFRAEFTPDSVKATGIQDPVQAEVKAAELEW